jgi:diguanylate cyclase (GGDEF)-like protein
MELGSKLAGTSAFSEKKSTAPEAIKILIVEDDPDDVYLIKEYLNADTRKKYLYKHVTTLESAIKEIEKGEIDLILLDLGLPDADGLTTLSFLNDAGCTTPIVVLTGVDDHELGEEAIQLGAEDYLPKKIANTLLLTRSINYSIERHRLLLELKRKAELDPLTGLPNRTMIYDKLEFMIQLSERSGKDFALVMLDFDKFKYINDTLGHRFGDRLLQAFAQRLKTLMRKSDYVSRYGGDEFFMIVSNYENDKELEMLMRRKQEALSKPYQVEMDGKIIEQGISISFGIMRWGTGLSASQMLERADQAMYSSKRNTVSSLTFY